MDATEVYVLEDSSDDEPYTKSDKVQGVGQASVDGTAMMTTSDGDNTPGSQQRKESGKDAAQEITVQPGRTTPEKNLSILGADTETTNEESTPLIPPNKIRYSLRDYVKNATKNTKFAYEETLKNWPNPGLRLVGQEPIGFPLSQHGIDAIRSASTTSANDDEGSQQNLWIVPAAQWTTNNPEWERYLRVLMGRFTKEVEATYYDAVVKADLVLYGPGARVQSRLVHPVDNVKLLIS